MSFESEEFGVLITGYALTSYSQSQSVERVLINADAQESDLLLNQRMGYVAVSRAREDAIVFTNPADQLRAALDRNIDKETALEALRQSRNGDGLYWDEWESLVSPTGGEASAEQSFDQIVSRSIGERTDDERVASEEIELELYS